MVGGKNVAQVSKPAVSPVSNRQRCLQLQGVEVSVHHYQLQLHPPISHRLPLEAFFDIKRFLAIFGAISDDDALRPVSVAKVQRTAMFIASNLFGSALPPQTSFQSRSDDPKIARRFNAWVFVVPPSSRVATTELSNRGLWKASNAQRPKLQSSDMFGFHRKQ